MCLNRQKTPSTLEEIGSWGFKTEDLGGLNKDYSIAFSLKYYNIQKVHVHTMELLT